jgi:hypothetical protein
MEERFDRISLYGHDHPSRKGPFATAELRMLAVGRKPPRLQQKFICRDDGEQWSEWRDIPLVIGGSP